MAGDHRCEVCGATFTRPQHVGRHMRSHTGDKPYACPHCPDRFARSDLLSRHVNKTHCPPDPNAPVQTGRKKKVKEVTTASAQVNGNANTGAGNGMANGAIQPELNGRTGNAAQQGPDARWRHDSNGSGSGSGERASVSSSPQYQQQYLMHNQQQAQQQYQLYQQQQQQQQALGWVGSGVSVGPLAGGDVIERLAAGTVDLDGEESEDEDAWDGTQPGMFPSTNGFPLNPTIQQMANMQLHQVPTGFEMGINGNQAFVAGAQAGSQILQTQPQQQQQTAYQVGVPPFMNQVDTADYLPSPQRNTSFGSWYQPISPGLMAAPPIHPIQDGSKCANGQQQSNGSPIPLGSSPLINMVSPTSAGPSHSVSPSSSAMGRPIDLGASLSPSSSSSGQIGLPFGDGYSSSMPVLAEDAGSSSNNVYVNRPAKKRACEQCNASKVKCDSQLPCQKCTMRGLRCTYPIAKKLGRKRIGADGSEPQPWMYMPGQEPFAKPEDPVDRRSSIHFGTANTSSPMAAMAHQVARNSLSALQGMPPPHFGRFRDNSLDDDAVSLTSGYGTSHTEGRSRRESMADSIHAVEDEHGAGLLQMMDMGIAPAAIEGVPPNAWSVNGMGTGMEATGMSRPAFPSYQIDGTVTQRAPSLSDVKDAWRQFASGQQPISIGGLVPGPQTRPAFVHRARSNSVPHVYPPNFADLAMANFALTPRAEAEAFNFNRPASLVASPADIQGGSSSPASIADHASQSESSQMPPVPRGSSGNSSVSMVEAMLPTSTGSNNARVNVPPGQDATTFAATSARAGQNNLTQPPVPRPTIAVFQPTAAGNVARHILQGGSQTLAPERPPSFINASFLDTERNKFKVPGFAGQSGFYAQPIVSTKMSSLAARPGNKRLPSQTLGPDYQKKMPIGADFGQASPFGNMYSPSLFAGTPSTTHSQQGHARRASVPGWVGGTPFGQNELVDSESSFLQAAFPGTMAVPDFTPTQNPLLGSFPFPLPNYS